MKLLAAFLFFGSVSGMASEYFRAFTDQKGNFLTVRGNSVAWGDGKLFHALPTEKFTATPTTLHFTFDSGNFESTADKPTLECGPKSRQYTELTSKEALTLRSRMRFEPPLAPAKPMLLGLLGGTQLFLYVDAALLGPGQGHPRFQLYFGPVRQLKAYPTWANAGSRETVITARDLRIVIQPGSQGSGVLIHYKNSVYPFDYLRNTNDNLIAVLGDGLFKKLFAQREKTVCDSVNGE